MTAKTATSEVEAPQFTINDVLLGVNPLVQQLGKPENAAQAKQLGMAVRQLHVVGLPWLEQQKEALRESQAASLVITGIQVGGALMVITEGWKRAKDIAEWFRT